MTQARLSFLALVLALTAVVAVPVSAAQDAVLISEFMASNERTLADEDGDYSDWIEIYNSGSQAVDLTGWYLTDSAGNKTKWRFPAVTLEANRFLLVFASNKDRRRPGEPLHTNFRLSSSPGYLALVKPDGVTVAHQYAPYPVQTDDIAYGLTLVTTQATLLSTGAAARVLVPTDDSLGLGWTQPDFDDAAWTAATTGVGYETEGSVTVVVADSAAEFSGVQGQDNWFYGYYNLTRDTVAGYQASNFVAFPSGEAPFSGLNFWTGTAWDWFAGNPPWDEIGATFMHPNGRNNNEEHWVIRRWVSEVAGSITVDWTLAKANPAGNGVTGIILHNGAERDKFSIAGANTTGVSRSITIHNVQIGDFIDVALTPVGPPPGNDTGDGSDGSTMTAVIKTAVSLAPLISTDIEGPMRGNNASAYVRVPFTVTDPTSYDFLTVRMKYDDGAVVYLNGTELFSRNATPFPQWNAAATGTRDETLAGQFEEVDVSRALVSLRPGWNVLAIHGLNAAADDADFLVLPEVRASRLSIDTATPRYLPGPTPGAANGEGAATLGPLITDVRHTPKQPNDDQDLVVTARAEQTFRPVTRMELVYRVMFNPEVTVQMFDDGQHGDGPAGDGQFGATIPAAASTNGQMVRYFIRATDSSNVVSRLPSYQNTNNSPQYFGTVVKDPSLVNPLPVVHLFIPQTTLNNVHNDSLGRYPASIYFLGEFYDNIGINRHGQSSAGGDFLRKSYDLDFNPGNLFKWKEGEDRVDDINLLTTYPDKAKMRNMLAYGTYRDADAPYHFVEPVRVQHNAVYFGDWHMVENGDENFLKRLGFDPRGALYKMYNDFNQAADTTIGVNGEFAEKKTRKHEGSADLLALFNGVNAPGAARTAFIYDNLNIPEVVNFLAARVVTADIDCCHKNYYLYRDSEGTGEWYAMPWDVDLSFGRNWTECSNYWGDGMHPENGLRTGNNNSFFNAIFNTPALLQMYQRRVRTLIDELLQPPGTPAHLLKYEAQMDYWLERIAPDAELEKTRWATWGNCSSPSTASTQSVAQAVEIMKTRFMAPRRTNMFSRAGAWAELPAAQPENVVIRIGAVEVNPSSGNQEQEYIQLVNPNTIAVDISGWKLGGAVDFTFRGGTVLPANSTGYVSPNVLAFRQRATYPRGGTNLFVVGPYRGHLSARGETIYLTNKAGMLVSSNQYPANPSPQQLQLRITEIMYHPAPAANGAFAAEEFEYLELKNVGANTISLVGVHFGAGIDFTFTDSSAVTSLAGGQAIVLVRNPAAFVARYGTGPIIGGQYGGQLENGGERLTLFDASNEEILDFDYENDWYPVTDGAGFSLVTANENAEPDAWDGKAGWRPSGTNRGSPGQGDTPVATVGDILVNEVLAHSDPPLEDYIELYNAGTNDVNVGGWFISDDFAQGQKYRIPDGTVIPAGGYLVISETAFNTGPNAFSFSSQGDEAYVFSGDGTHLTGYFHGYSFGASATDVSLGRHVTSLGEVHFVAQSARTPGAANAAPAVGPVVITEVMYHPPDLADGEDNRDDEFIELRNVSDAPVTLFNGADTWRIRGGVEFDFPPGVTVAPEAFVLIVGFHPADMARVAAFKARYGLGAEVVLYGPYTGALGNGGDDVRLLRPDAPEAGGETPYVLIDRVEFSDAPPWPTIADGVGPSIQRLREDDYGNDVINWTGVAPTPNAPYPGGTVPFITTQPQSQAVVATHTATLTVVAGGTPPLSYQWRFNGSLLPGATGDSLIIEHISPRDAGTYSVTVYNGAGSVESSNAVITVLIPASITRQPANAAVRPGGTTNFTVIATSTSPLSYQWQKDGVNIAGATNNVLTIANAQLSDGGTYRALVTDAVGTIQSDPAVLTILIDPVIVVHPIAAEVAPGSDYVLSVQVTNTATLPIGYRWRRNGTTVVSNSLASFVNFFVVTNVQGSNLWDVIVNNQSRPGGNQSARVSVKPGVDTDGDGILDSVEIALGMNPNDPADANVDADGDGMTNGEEVVAGTNPADPASYFKVDRIAGGNSATVEFSAVAGRSYTIQFNDQPGDPAGWRPLQHLPARTNSYTATIRDTNAPSQRIYRLATPVVP